MKWIVHCVLVLSVALGVCGCEGNEDDGDTTANVAGTWDMTSSRGSILVVTLSQSGNSVTGTFVEPGNAQNSGTITGTVSANTFVATGRDYGYYGLTVVFTATVNGDNMSGTWAQSDGHEGTFNASRR